MYITLQMSLKIEPQRLTEYYNIETGEKVVV